MKIMFPQTLEAAKAAEKSQWKIGDALVREVEDEDNSVRGLHAVAEELAQHDIDYSPNYLGQMRITSAAFPRDRRLDLPWKVHTEAGNPDTLDVIVKAARRDGQKVTKWYVADVLRQLREEANREREKEIAAANREAAKAEEAERKAREKEAVAQTEREKQAAKRARQAATDRKRQAQAKAKAAKSYPKKRDRTPPHEDNVSILRATAGVKANGGHAKRLATESLKLLKHGVGDLSPGIIAGLTDAAMSAANAWTEVANFVRSATPDKRGHLSVVNE